MRTHQAQSSRRLQKFEDTNEAAHSGNRRKFGLARTQSEEQEEEGCDEICSKEG